MSRCLSDDAHAQIVLQIRSAKQGLEALAPAIQQLPAKQRLDLPGISWLCEWIALLERALCLLDEAEKSEEPTEL